MKEIVVKFAVDILLQRIGVHVKAHNILGESPCIELFPADVDPHDSFSVRFTPGWRSAEAEFVPGKFAAPLIEQMGAADSENKSTFIAFACALKSRNTRLIFRVNGVDISPLDSSNWPSKWNKIELVVRSSPQVIECDDIAQMRQLIIELVVPVFGMIAALIGVEEAETPINIGLEGTPFQSFVTYYEHKKVNREACIQLKGLRCVACGFDFSIFYGQIGFGYIEVHHVVPVSKLGADYRIDVSSDLEPLCANCHAMVHRENPPIPASRLAEMIACQIGK